MKCQTFTFELYINWGRKSNYLKWQHKNIMLKNIVTKFLLYNILTVKVNILIWSE